MAPPPSINGSCRLRPVYFSNLTLQQCCCLSTELGTNYCGSNGNIQRFGSFTFRRIVGNIKFTIDKLLHLVSYTVAFISYNNQSIWAESG